jgi:uncharacterized protein (DUF488 family)
MLLLSKRFIILRSSNTNLTILTIGHSTHPLKEFIALLKEYHITHLIDVRTIARSRYNPQFNEARLRTALKKHGIKYTHMSGLGGLRNPSKDSLNTGWHNASFRGYADYMQTEEFVKNIDDLIELAREDQIVIMCAEALPWRCHRSLIGDALLIRGIHVEDIFSLTSKKPHTLTAFAQVKGKKIVYPEEN